MYFTPHKISSVPVNSDCTAQSPYHKLTTECGRQLVEYDDDDDVDHDQRMILQCNHDDSLIPITQPKQTLKSYVFI